MEKRIGAAVLLALSLLAVAAVADEVAFSIRLPSDGKEQFMDATRPWACCDKPSCGQGHCFCNDSVKQCGAACKQCDTSRSNPSLVVCRDEYIGGAGPRCNGLAAGDNQVLPVANVEKTKGEKEGGAVAAGRN